MTCPKSYSPKVTAPDQSLGLPAQYLSATAHNLSFFVPVGETLGRDCFFLCYLTTQTQLQQAGSNEMVEGSAFLSPYMSNTKATDPRTVAVSFPSILIITTGVIGLAWSCILYPRRGGTPGSFQDKSHFFWALIFQSQQLLWLINLQKCFAPASKILPRTKSEPLLTGNRRNDHEYSIVQHFCCCLKPLWFSMGKIQINPRHDGGVCPALRLPSRSLGRIRNGRA